MLQFRTGAFPTTVWLVRSGVGRETEGRKERYRRVGTIRICGTRAGSVPRSKVCQTSAERTVVARSIGFAASQQAYGVSSVIPGTTLIYAVGHKTCDCASEKLSFEDCCMTYRKKELKLRLECPQT